MTPDEALVACVIGVAFGVTLVVLGVKDLVAWMLEGGPDDAGAKVDVVCWVCSAPATMYKGRAPYCKDCGGALTRRDWA